MPWLSLLEASLASSRLQFEAGDVGRPLQNHALDFPHARVFWMAQVFPVIAQEGDQVEATVSCFMLAGGRDKQQRKDNFSPGQAALSSDGRQVPASLAGGYRIAASHTHLPRYCPRLLLPGRFWGLDPCVQYGISQRNQKLLSSTYLARRIGAIQS